ncbi:right-handed parallel beta-helix repeat-containing protein [Ovoidimarina sediminis]|uniref:right-handed parallel beta-helix repeat-containing protein n=1 Tax=Ovoidimarina sediminis TaxID=3079856 RepID=UPI00291556D7|nr:right-handed parallel beta-helix repeat-containing protein [Rhodophyticola sp. MJ-SS7]MDU8943463.1 right-handed parallel beta-helix repeat-containing protein [Rhodophyticola sp. MJ-SS7]
MNKVITDGLSLMPPEFAGGLDVWSSEDGTPGSATYDGDPNAAFVPADQDFGGALELLKTTATQRLRWMGETPVLPGCYLRVRARVKAISGNLPSVRIAAWPGGAGSAYVPGLVETGPTVALSAYGDIVEVSAILGTGNRTGVDMQWSPDVLYAHVGLDLTGATGGVVRIDDLVVEDITSAFHRSMMDWVDVRDYGAVGDGVTDDRAAFEAADLAAAGRDVLIPEGIWALGSSMTFENAVRFEGTVAMAAGDRLILRRNFDLPSYADAFGDEVEGFRRAFQALLHFSDHESLDLKGRRIEIDAPLDMAAIAGVSTYEIRRVIRNGQINCLASSSWDDGVQTSDGTYDAASPLTLTNVTNVANIAVGAHVTGVGVGREIYVTATNVGAQTVTLSKPLYGPAATQSYTFTRYRYALDFSGFTVLSRLQLDDIDIDCNGVASGVMLAPSGSQMHLRDCWITKPRDRGVTSIGQGCQGLQIDRCNIISDEQSTAAPDRVSVGLNVNANDAKIRDSRFQRLGTSMILAGTGNLIVGNHWFQGDTVTDGPRVAGLVFTQPNVKSVVTGNYVDNAFIEMTNEHDATPDFDNQFSFGGLTVTGNIFTANDAAAWFSFLVITPYGSGHYLQGLSVTGNSFKAINGDIDRVERVDASFAALDYSRTRNVTFAGNTFNGIAQNTINPVTLEFDQPGALQNWQIDPSAYLPFGGWAREVSAMVTEGPVQSGLGADVSAMPYVTTNDGPAKNQVRLTWPEPVSGRVHVTSRTDRPI